MAKGINKVILLGHVGMMNTYKANNGNNVVRLSIATNEKWKDKATGELKEATEWHSVVLYGKTADICMSYVNKGTLMYIEGSLRTNKYESDGQEKWSTDIVGRIMQICTPKGDVGSNRQPSPPPDEPPPYYDKNKYEDPF